MSAVLDAIARAVLDATGAAAAWVVVGGPNGEPVVAAVAGRSSATIGSPAPAAGSAVLAISSGMPAARTFSTDDATGNGAAGLEEHPGSVLTVPFGDPGGGGGAVEVAGRSMPFTIDDIEVVSLLADVAGAAAVESTEPVGAAGPSPDELAAELRALAEHDPRRYRDVAAVIGALLAVS